MIPIMLFEEDMTEKAVRRIRSCKYTLHSVIDDLEDPQDVESRADLLLAVEDLNEVLQFLLETTRNIAWQFSFAEGESDELE